MVTFSNLKTSLLGLYGAVLPLWGAFNSCGERSTPVGSLNPLNACSRPLGPVADTVSWGLFLLQINSIVFAPAFTGIRTKKYSPHIFVPTHYMKPLDQLGSYLVNELLILWVVVLVQLL